MSVADSEAARLPPELEREIFEYTAELYPGVIPNLLCLAHRVFVWIEPIVYHTIYVDSSRRISSFLTATTSKPPEFFATHVRRIFIYNSVRSERSLEDARAALALCTNVTHIAGAGPLASPLLLPVLTPLRLERMALFLTHIFFDTAYDVDLTLLCFQTLTHVDVFDYLSDEDAAMDYVRKLCSLPVLTHLALNDEVSWEAVQTLLRDCTCLEILVVQWSESKESGRARAREARLELDLDLDAARFLMTMFERMEDAALDPPNLWSQAETFVADKRRGKIDSRCFWMTRGEEEEDDESESESEPEEEDDSSSGSESS
ncbi:hypothetical protein C8F01DRAFT_1249179 [Mycena amicta]|nr:hypothetical protein C8F01DRAFT_1249179 [Mycena amicta]